jgi:hypothetical protein
VYKVFQRVRTRGKKHQIKKGNERLSSGDE